MNVRLRQVWRWDRNGHPQDAPDGNPRGRAAEEPVLRAASGVLSGTPGTWRIWLTLEGSIQE